ncbi:MAG: glycosyltransferase family 2 protein [bacterium]|nr:glycosyltransferase family 2 protein [bacterium]
MLQPNQKEPYAVSVVMPVFNEAEVIAEVVRQFGKVLERFERPEFVIVNDCSTDETGAVLKELQGQYPYLRVVHNERNKGFGPTLIRALSEGRGEYIFYSDGDNQFNAEDFWLVWARMRRDNLDVAIGYRHKRQDSATRIVITSMLKVIALALFGIWLPDGNSPFRLHRREALRVMLQKLPKSRPVAPSAPLTLVAYKLGMRIGWVAVRHYARATGNSVFNSRKILKLAFAATIEIIRLRVII